MLMWSHWKKLSAFLPTLCTHHGKRKYEVKVVCRKRTTYAPEFRGMN
jgi:hypothetical protein